MANIGGNIKGTLQSGVVTENPIGEQERSWKDEMTLTGWLGLQSGEKKYDTFDAKIEESTHVFLCDFDTAAYALADRDLRMVCKNRVYDVLLIDNPDEMDEQLEIYLKRTGAYEGIGKV